MEIYFEFEHTVNKIHTYVSEIGTKIIAHRRTKKGYVAEDAGHAELLLINIYKCYQYRVNPWELFDSLSLNVHEIGDTLFTKYGELRKNISEAISYGMLVFTENLSTIIIGNHLAVRPKFRGQEIARQLNCNLVSVFHFDLLVTKPFPLQYEADGNPADYEGYDDSIPFEKARKKLVKYYKEKCGMTSIRGIKKFLFLLPHNPNPVLDKFFKEEEIF